jgi:hypothetical protein
MKKNILEIYEEYNLMPNLIEHQLRVTAVAQLVCENFQKDIDTSLVITTMLFHDMGNIIKFNLTKFPQFCEPEGHDHWESVRQNFIQKYGEDEHEAHLKIARELGLSERVIELMDGVEFHKMLENYQDPDWEQKICAYADARVGPFGVLSLHDRLEEGRVRYEISPDDERWDLINAAEKMEEQIFENMPMHPSEINDETIKDVVNQLKNMTVEVKG